VRVIVGVVGKPRNRALSEAIREYESRAARYWPLDVREVKEEPARGSVQASMVREREGERLRKRVGEARLVPCEVGGREMSSEELASWLQEQRESATDVAFLIGGAYGLDPAFREQAVRLLSLSRMTLPHELARLVLAEQLYRAGTIIRGEPYHK
jgi:23S rRNA (pseudouridine1915-N3)-methyltransferase